MNLFKREFKNILDAWDRFWFGPVDLYNLGLFRCVLFSILFVMYFLRILEVRLLFFNEGLMPFSLAKEFPPAFYKPLFFWFPTSNTAVASG